MKKSTSALVLIDLQKESNFGLLNVEQAIANAGKVLEKFRALEIPIIYTRQINRTDQVNLSVGEPLNEDGTPKYYNDQSSEIEIFDEIKPESDELVIDKYRWSAFFETSLDLTLRSLGVKDVYIGGFVTDGCLMTSVYDAYFRDYNIHLIHDMSTASNEGAHQSAILNMANWVYNLKIYDSKNLIRKMNGEKYSVWEADQADTMQFTKDTMEEKFSEIINR
ncbi:cysteine hydrolase family protein [Halalkalibacillus halophilus]|uniref:cysteine hydrolase family protein n=1 Tax=Halalkalibacillus halophilus TaxID=392827 RepID=UPI000400DE0F|nr:isochorismatase family cysteine hydrolase [Halalkalibacillus halophilus]